MHEPTKIRSGALLVVLACAPLAGRGAGDEIPLVRFEAGAAARDAAPKPVVRELLAGEVPGVSVRLVSVAGGAVHAEPESRVVDKVYLVLHGSGALSARGQEHAVSSETIARLPLGWPARLRPTGATGMDVLVIHRELRPDDLQELKKHPTHNEGPYVRRFRDCEAYGESIKSAKTVSRTLLPENYVPRMAVGTVEAVGPDKVGSHSHPMLEQLFLGLAGNRAVVHADEAEVAFPEDSLLHIPRGSSHWVEVAEGSKLYYVWLDFFESREGQLWLKTHKPVDAKASPKP